MSPPTKGIVENTFIRGADDRWQPVHTVSAEYNGWVAAAQRMPDAALDMFRLGDRYSLHLPEALRLNNLSHDEMTSLLRSTAWATSKRPRTS